MICLTATVIWILYIYLKLLYIALLMHSISASCGTINNKREKDQNDSNLRLMEGQLHRGLCVVLGQPHECAVAKPWLWKMAIFLGDKNISKREKVHDVEVDCNHHKIWSFWKLEVPCQPNTSIRFYMDSQGKKAFLDSTGFYAASPQGVHKSKLKQVWAGCPLQII